MCCVLFFLCLKHEIYVIYFTSGNNFMWKVYVKEASTRKCVAKSFIMEQRALQDNCKELRSDDIQPNAWSLRWNIFRNGLPKRKSQDFKSYTTKKQDGFILVLFFCLYGKDSQEYIEMHYYSGKSIRSMTDTKGHLRSFYEYDPHYTRVIPPETPRNTRVKGVSSSNHE